MESIVADRRILYATAFLRAVSTGLLGVLLGVHLARVGLTARYIGGIITAGLAGAACAAALATFVADRIGRRRFLLGVAALSVAGTVLFAASSNPVTLALAAFLGMLNGMGRDRGAALVLEQAALPATTTDAGRTRTIAVYTMLQDLGHAAGALLAAIPSVLARTTHLAGTAPHRATLLGCAAIGVVITVFYAGLGSSIERGVGRSGHSASSATRGILARISALFAIDALAGGFLTTSMLSYFFFERFGVEEGVIGALFFCARLLNAASHLGAAFLAKRIGLVNTMVFTHIPSSLLLVTVAYAKTFPIAASLFLLREGLVEMDVPTRQSYVLAVVAPEDRTLASGVTNLVRLGSWAVAPAFAGALTEGGAMFLPLVIGAGMKIFYDIALYFAFRRVRPPEERVIRRLRE
jgi:MFS family permease